MFRHSKNKLQYINIIRKELVSNISETVSLIKVLMFMQTMGRHNQYTDVGGGERVSEMLELTLHTINDLRRNLIILYSTNKLVTVLHTLHFQFAY